MRRLIATALGASLLAAPFAAYAMEPIIPEGEPLSLIVEGDSFRLYYPVPKRKTLDFEVEGPGVVLLFAVNHRRGKRKGLSVVEVLRNGKLWKTVRLGCPPSSTTFAATKGRDRPCGRISSELPVGSEKIRISLRLDRSKYGASVAPHFVTEAELQLEPDLVGLSATEDPPPEPPNPPPIVEGEEPAETVAEPSEPVETESLGINAPNEASITEESPAAADDEFDTRWIAPTLTLVGAAAAGGLGFYFAGQHNDNVDAAENTEIQLERENFLDDADSDALRANIAFGVAGATAILGTYFLIDYLLDDDVSESSSVSDDSGISGGCGPDGCGAWLWFDFD
ncbi:MAG: hypothetical protein AAFQ77_00560 [Myxococcota bacterium]